MKVIKIKIRKKYMNFRKYKKIGKHIFEHIIHDIKYELIEHSNQTRQKKEIQLYAIYGRHNSQ